MNNYQTDPDIIFKVQPDASAKLVTADFNVEFVTNSHGSRDREYDLSKTPETCRALVVGDSFPVGFGVNQENVFSEILERWLNVDEAKSWSRK